MLKKDKDRYGMQNGGPKPDFLDLDGDGNKEESMKKASEDKKEMREPKVLGGITRALSKTIKSLLNKQKSKVDSPKKTKQNPLSPEERKKLEQYFESRNKENFPDEQSFKDNESQFNPSYDVDDIVEQISEDYKGVREFDDILFLTGSYGEDFIMDYDKIDKIIGRKITKREPKVFGGLARQAARLLSKSRRKNVKPENLTEDDILDYNKLVPDDDKILIGDSPQLLNIAEEPIFPNFIDDLDNPVTVKDAKLKLKQYEELVEEMKNEPGLLVGGRNMYELQEAENIVDALERDIQKSIGREPKVLGGLARGISKQLQKFISSSKSGMKTIQEGMQEPISPNELSDVLEYNKLVSNPQDKIFYKKSDADYSSFFRNYIDGENSVITIKDAKQVLKESKKDLKQKRKEANTGQEMDELEMFENMVSDLEIDIRMIELDEPSIDKARGLLSEGGNVDKEMEQLKNMYEEGGEAKMIPDEQMEEQFVDFVIDEALSDKEESMLMEQLEANPELSMIFDKVIEKASEFTGAGEVDGPGTGTSDSIPARLSDGEFVFTAKSVEQIGADNLMKMMKDAEAAYDAGEDREKMQEGGLQEMSMDMERDMPNKKEVEVTYNVNRPETVSTVQPLLAREEEEDLITQELKKGMLGPSNMR